MITHKIPASITLAQGILESGSGRSDLARNANNHFGIKCTSDYTGEKYLKDDNIKNDCFRVYAHAEESYRDHSLFLTGRKHYGNLFTLDITDYKAWAKGLKEAGYATNPKYPELLIAVIEQNRLYEYDEDPESFLKDDEKKEQPNTTILIPSQRIVIEPENIETGEKSLINGVRCVLVKPGDTFYGLSRKHDVSIESLRKHNDFPDNHILKAGEYVFLQKKKRKYKEQEYHEVKTGETLHLISQKYGVRERCLKKRNDLKTEISEGMKLKLN
jgi:LysM repeat protein